jgi:hypothetical protein
LKKLPNFQICAIYNREKLCRGNIFLIKRNFGKNCRITHSNNFHSKITFLTFNDILGFNGSEEQKMSKSAFYPFYPFYPCNSKISAETD